MQILSLSLSQKCLSHNLNNTDRFLRVPFVLPTRMSAFEQSSSSSSSSLALSAEEWSYPEGTVGHENKHGTYWPHLNAHASEQLAAVQAWVTEQGIDMDELCSFALDHQLTLLRYLRANNFDFRKTVGHITRNLQYRREKRVQHILQTRPENILGFKMAELTTIYPHWHMGFDKTGRPVHYQMYGKFDASRIKKMGGGSLDNVMLYHIWEQEARSQLCYSQSKKTKTIIETCTGVIDVKHMSMFQVTRDFLHLVQMMAEIDQNQYPETLGRLYIINTPMAFPMAWKLVKPWIDPVTAAKIHILSSPREFEPALAEFIGVENLPANYGGHMPPLNEDMHPYAQTMEEMDSHELAANITEKELCNALKTGLNIPADIPV